MRIAVANDHAGLLLKGHVLDHLRGLGHEVVDVGPNDAAPVDFPVVTQRATDLVRSGAVERAVMVCGSGVGACIAANKVPGIRAALIHDTYVAHQAVEHDDVNVACLGAWVVGPTIAREVLTSFLGARFSTDEDFRRRVAQLDEMDERRSGAPPSP